jgi:cellulose biosynthesis protein BcsQ
MPTIAFVSPKGGVEKTTSAFLFSTAVAKVYDVTLIDADPNHPIQTWAEGGNTPPRLTIISDADEDTIIDRIEAAATKTPSSSSISKERRRRLWSMRCRRRTSSSFRRRQPLDYQVWACPHFAFYSLY